MLDWGFIQDVQAALAAFSLAFGDDVGNALGLYVVVGFFPLIAGKLVENYRESACLDLCDFAVQVAVESLVLVLHVIVDFQVDRATLLGKFLAHSG